MTYPEIANAKHEARRRGMVTLPLYRDGHEAGIAIVLEDGFRKCWTPTEFTDAMNELPDQPHDYIKSMKRNCPDRGGRGFVGMNRNNRCGCKGRY